MSSKEGVYSKTPCFNRFKDRIKENVPGCDGKIFNYAIDIPEWNITLFFDSMDEMKEHLGVEQETK